MSFQAFTDANQRRQLAQERTQRLATSPFGTYQLVSVAFPTANTDVAVPHAVTGDPETIRWVPIALSAAGVVFRGGGASIRPWTTQVLYLQSSVAQTVRLLLFQEASNDLA